MKKVQFGRKFLAVAVSTLALGCAFADGVENLVVRQRWPWCEVVDIDFTVSSLSNVDVEVTATWEGQSSPVDLTAAGFTGNTMSVHPATATHCTWDARAAGYQLPLANFRVQVNVISPESRKYLVCNLKTGTYEFMAAEPDGGWTDEHKKNYMVFRRIPAGTFRMGFSDAELTRFNLNADRGQGHQVTLSDDFYIAIHPITRNQSYRITNNSDKSSPLKCDPLSYADLRGNLNDDGVNWPTTQYKVSEGSLIGKFRSKFNNRLLFDLPTEAQWERAARGGVNTLLPNGGESTDSDEVLNGLADEIAVWKVSGLGEVTTKAANGYGLYDVCGYQVEWVLDHYHTALGTAPAVDPVGKDIPSPTPDHMRIIKGGSYESGFPVLLCPGYADYKGNGVSSARFGARLAIHLRSLFE